MNHVVVALAWCWVQTLVVAGLAIVLSWVAMRYSAAAGRAIAWAGILATLALTLLALAPMPRWAIHWNSAAPRAAAADAQQDGARSAANSPVGSSTAAEVPFGFALNAAGLSQIAASVQ
jgi:hypothetical protein